MIIERLVLVFGVALLLISIAAFLKHRQSQQATSASVSLGHSPNTTETLQIIYFWSTQCSQCSMIQTPIIDDLTNNIGLDKLVITKINISESQEQARRWGVRTVPSTYILDKKGTVQHMNNGLASGKMLTEQLQSLGRL